MVSPHRVSLQMVSATNGIAHKGYWQQKLSATIALRVSQQDLSADCKTRNFVGQFAQIRALFQNVNKKKIIELNPSSRVGFEGSFKTASSELKKFKTGQCL